MPRGRKSQSTVETAESNTIPLSENSVEIAPKRRGRRVKAAEPINETSILIDALLRLRGARGATADVLQTVITWANGVREEGLTIQHARGEATRRQKSEISADRIAKYEMNLALLTGVLNGAIFVNVEENGDLVFRHANLGHGESPEVTTEVQPE